MCSLIAVQNYSQAIKPETKELARPGKSIRKHSKTQIIKPMNGARVYVPFLATHATVH